MRGQLMRLYRSTIVALVVALAVESTARAAGIPTTGLEEIVVTAKRLIGQSVSASQGTVLAVQLEHRPMLRTAEVLEVVPGLIVTQHSGDGKANQYFLRGFNLDHGTDFATTVDGLPVNLPTHAHGQGYSDLNFLIPELVDRIEYRKGTYYANKGNFSAAGAADIAYRRTIAAPELALSMGEDSYMRAMGAGSLTAAGGYLLLAGAYEGTDGPWDLAENSRKVTTLAKYTRGASDRGFGVTFMGYDGSWQSTDQIPQRAVDSGLIDRFGFIDPTDGGDTWRYSLSAQGWGQVGEGTWTALGYAVDYGLDLFSNFTYAIDTENGDQFEQFDRRHVYGGEVGYSIVLSGLAQGADLQTGLQLRRDDISTVGLYLTHERLRHDTVREDAVSQTSYSAFASLDIGWTSWLRSEFGLRADAFEFDVESDLAANSGSASDSIVSPKLTLVLGPWASTEVFINAGAGFHSNDARGTTITVDPNDGVTPVDQVDALVRARGAELGVRTAAIPNLQLAASLWGLKLDSELLFVGDGGTTEPSRPTERYGVEVGAYFTPIENIIIDADLAFSHPRFSDDESAGDRIPGAIESAASLGATFTHPRGFFGGARVRYLGPAALVEDNSVRSESTTLLNLEGGYRFTERLSASITLLNALDEKANDITYYYESRLPGEAAPVMDLHVHPVELRTLRVGVRYSFE